MSFESSTFRFACDNPDQLLDRLRLSYVHPADNDQQYTPDALSQSPPRHLNPAEQAAVIAHMIATPDTPPGAVVELLNDPRHWERLVRLQDMSKLAVEAAFRDLMPRRAQLVDVIYSEPDRTNTCRIDLDRFHFTPGMNNHAGKRPGLHVDNAFHLPLRYRLDSPRRLGLNFGPGRRWLLMVVPDILAVAEQQQLGQHEVPKTQHFAEYTRTLPNYSVPCLWLRQHPGEAYIAPVELIVHDGTTQGGRDGSTMAFWAWHEQVGILPSVFTPDVQPVGSR